MGVLKMPFHVGFKVLGYRFEFGGDSDRARRAIADTYAKSGGVSPELKRDYSEYLAYKRAREAEGKSV